MNNLKLVAVLVLLPLCLVLLGSWELQRSGASIREHGELAAYLNELKPRLMSLSARSGNHLVDMGGKGVSAGVALERVDSIIADLGTLRGIDWTRQALAIAVFCLGVLASLIGLCSLLGLSWAAWRAQRSREQLLHTFTKVSKVLPYVLVSHVLVTSAALGAVLGFEGLGVWRPGQMSSGEFKVMALAALIMFACLYSIWHVARQLRVMLHMFEPTALSVLGQVVTPEQAPGLWAFVNTLAERLGALAPQHIVVGMSEGFYVTSSDIQLLPGEIALAGRTLHVPITYLGVLDTAQISAVIGHELAHFAGEDTEYSLRFLPIYDGIGRSLGVIGMMMIEGGLLRRTLLRPAFMLGVHFMHCFDHSVSHWSRQRELAADAAGATLAGNLAAASALVRISAIEPLLVQALEARIEQTIAPNNPQPRPDDLPASLIHELAEKHLALPDEHMAVQLPHPSDTHPSNGERAAALQVEVDDAVSHGLRPVVAAQAYASLAGYFSDAQALCKRLGEDFLDHYAAQAAEVVQHLQEVADQVSGEVRLHEGARIQGWVTTVLFGGGAVAGLMLVAVPFVLGSRSSDYVFYISGGLLAAEMLRQLSLSVRLICRANETALLLTPDHLVFANLKQPVPIRDIADVRLDVLRGMHLIFQLKKDAVLPQVSSHGYFKPWVTLDKERRILRLHLQQFYRDNKSLSPDELVSLVASYLNAGNTRHIL